MQVVIARSSKLFFADKICAVDRNTGSHPSCHCFGKRSRVGEKSERKARDPIPNIIDRLCHPTILGG